MNLFRAILISAWILLALDSKRLTDAQELSLTVNDEVCGCSAAEYTFLLDFGLTCPPTNVRTGTGSGVLRVSCLVSPFGAPTDKLNPVIIDSVSVLELDQSNNVLVEERVGGGFVDGDSFSYSSVINNPDDVKSIQNIPKALQLNLSGRNEDGVMLMNVFVITFTNECGLTPVLQVGESAGWVRFAEMSGPIPEFCPTREPSSTPSEVPSPNPSSEPSSSPSSTPSKAPTRKPTQEPSTAPTHEPASSFAPSIFGMTSNEPSRCPTDPPDSTPEDTKKPTTRPTQVPILSDPPSFFETSMSMSMSLTKSLGMTFFEKDYSELLDGEVDLIQVFLND